MMEQKIVVDHRLEPLPEDGMLFVRTQSIFQTMVKASIVMTGILLMALAMPIQHSFSTTKTLDLVIYPDGATHVFTEIEADPLGLDYEMDLFGYDIDNFVAVGENGFLLSSEINDDVATVETFGDSTISVNFDIHDLVSKESRIWTFTIDSPTDFSLLMPKNIVIVGMSTLPINMEIIDDQIRLILPGGSTEINYVFGTPVITNPDDSSLSSLFTALHIVVRGCRNFFRNSLSSAWPPLSKMNFTI